MAVTFSYNSNSFPGEHDTFDPYNQVSTTTLDDQCTDGFTGTSASTPLVAGVIALVLQVKYVCSKPFLICPASQVLFIHPCPHLSSLKAYMKWGHWKIIYAFTLRVYR